MESPRKESPPAPASVSNLELSQLDLRYEGYRLRQPRLEERLLPSIAQEGIREALRGVPDASGGGGGAILLDGFKRLRCARKLHLGNVPFAPLGSGELEGILQLLRGSGDRHGLSQLEEARFVDELHAVRGLSVGEIAEALSRSKAWVSVRLGLLKALSPVVREALFAGDFPVHSYLYSVRPFKRLKGVLSADVDRFVQALCGQKLSVRQIDGLAHGFFRVPRTCPKCNGGGKIIANPCRTCSGRGQIKANRELSVDVPAGVDSGSRLRVSGEGEPGRSGGGRGMAVSLSAILR